jgi:hypothetical protein
MRENILILQRIRESYLSKKRELMQAQSGQIFGFKDRKWMMAQATAAAKGTVGDLFTSTASELPFCT